MTIGDPQQAGELLWTADKQEEAIIMCVRCDDLARKLNYISGQTALCESCKSVLESLLGAIVDGWGFRPREGSVIAGVIAELSSVQTGGNNE